MRTYTEYKVKLSDSQKSKLASAIRNNSSLTLGLKHSNLRGNDELMLTKRQIAKIRKSIANGTGSDIKISRTQIRKSVKHGGNLLTSLASLGAKVLPYTIKGVSKVAPALATGAVSALGELGINKLFGKGIPIPKKFFPMVAPFQRSLQKNRERKSTKLIKPEVEWLSNQQENRLKEDYWEHLPLLELHWQLVLYQRCLVPVFKLIEHHLVTQQKYGCHQPQHVARVNIHMHHHHSLEVGKMQLEQELKKILKKGKRNSTRKKQPVQFHSNSRRNFGNKALSNFDLFD